MITSIHRYELAVAAEPSDFYDVVDEAVRRGLFAGIPGLVDYQIMQGLKGERAGAFAALWMYESREAWREVWGTVDDPVPKSEYPDAWLMWEDNCSNRSLPKTRTKSDIDHTRSSQNVAVNGCARCKSDANRDKVIGHGVGPAHRIPSSRANRFREDCEKGLQVLSRRERAW